MRGRSRMVLVAALLGAAIAAGAATGSDAPPAGEAVRALAASVGALGGAHAYSTYMALGAVADGWACTTYPAEKVVRLGETLLQLADSARTALGQLLTSGAVSEEDRRYVEGMIDVYALLASEAKGLVAWVQTGERGSFDEARRRAWEAIRANLGEPEGEALE